MLLVYKLVQLLFEFIIIIVIILVFFGFWVMTGCYMCCLFTFIHSFCFVWLLFNFFFCYAPIFWLHMIISHPMRHHDGSWMLLLVMNHEGGGGGGVGVGGGGGGGRGGFTWKACRAN